MQPTVVDTVGARRHDAGESLGGGAVGDTVEARGAYSSLNQSVTRNAILSKRQIKYATLRSLPAKIVAVGHNVVVIAGVLFLSGAAGGNNTSCCLHCHVNLLGEVQ